MAGDRTMRFLGRLDRIADQLGELIVPDDVRAHVELAQAYLSAGNLDGAGRELAAALELKPDHARASYLLGLVHERRGDRAGARALYQRATEREGFVEPQLALGQLALVEDELDEAALAFRRALDTGPSDPEVRAEAYRGLGTAQLRAGRYDRAVRELRKAVASAPDEVSAQTLLGRALLQKGDLDTARICLERATRREPAPPEAWSARGEAALALDRGEEAERCFRAALAGISALPSGSSTRELVEAELAARLGLARLARTSGRLEEARGEVLIALGTAPSHLPLLVELGRIAAAARSPEVALDAFDRALAGAPPKEQGATDADGVVAGEGPTSARRLVDQRPLLDEALAISLRAGFLERAVRYAQELVLRRPSDPSARAALALFALAREPAELDEATRELGEADPNQGERSVELRLAEAALALARGERAQALVALRRAALLAPEDLRPRERYAALFHREEPAASDVTALLSAAHRLASSAPELAELGLAIGRLRESLDRPLIVTVMGEFNAGKSTFVNAFLGEEVAPMGVTPTTATVNLLKYGPERAGRVLYRDESTRDLPWAEVPAFLKGLSAQEARSIRLVELLYPLEVLQRINVVDTPGLNSIHAEHEEVARRFIDEADAVIWLFSIDQAAKASEGEALAKIAARGRKVLGVLNKIDRASDEEQGQIIEHVQRSVGAQLETIVPVSARAALLARSTHDEAALVASNYPRLHATLEERFFSRARQIQRRIALRRLTDLLREGTRQIDARLLGLGTELHERAAIAARADALAFARMFVPAERRRLLEAADEALGVCAREVLDFVRPRRSLFGGNEATPADRDFLLSLLEERIAAALIASRERLASALAPALALYVGLPGAPGAPELGTGPDPLAALDDRVFGRYRAYVRGYLRGGAVASFFSRDLPRLELTEAEVRRALERAAPLDDDTLEEELRQPLRSFGDRIFAELLARIELRRVEVALARFDLECRLADPLAALLAVLAAGEPPAS